MNQLDRAFDHRIRLGIMSLILVNDDVEFTRLKELMKLTDGNLASHIAALEKAKYIKVRKAFVGRKPRTTYQATTLGRRRFKAHLNALEAILKRHQ